MITRCPSFYENFKCLGGKCKKSCCTGWELDVDADTYEYYMSLPGEFGDRLRSELYLAEDDCHSFCLPIDGRCPFLNSENLCDIVLELGDESLCDICQTYPRYSFIYGNTIEKSLTISCEEACRLLLSEESGVSFVDVPLEYEDTEAYFDEDDPTPKEIDSFKANEKKLFSLIKDRSLSFEKRLSMIEGINEFTELKSKEIRLSILSNLEPVDDEWINTLLLLEKALDKSEINWNEQKYENLLVYFLFRYLPRSLFDGDFKSQVRFSLFCIYCIKDIEQIRGDLAISASLFSREVEHSDENIETIMEELIFSPL